MDEKHEIMEQSSPHTIVCFPKMSPELIMDCAFNIGISLLMLYMINLPLTSCLSQYPDLCRVLLLILFCLLVSCLILSSEHAWPISSFKKVNKINYFELQEDRIRVVPRFDRYLPQVYEIRKMKQVTLLRRYSKLWPDAYTVRLDFKEEYPIELFTLTGLKPNEMATQIAAFYQVELVKETR